MSGNLMYGERNNNTGDYNLVGGRFNKVVGDHCMATGTGLTVVGDHKAAVGMFNDPNQITTPEIIDVLWSVGNGTDEDNRSNAVSVGESIRGVEKISHLFVDELHLKQALTTTLIHSTNVATSMVLHSMIREKGIALKIGTPIVYTGRQVEIREMLVTDPKQHCIGVIGKNHRGALTHYMSTIAFIKPNNTIDISKLYENARLEDKIEYVCKTGIVLLRKDMLHLNLPKSWIKVSDYDDECDLYDIK